MSDYRAEQLNTYVGGPFLILFGLAAVGALGLATGNEWRDGLSPSEILAIPGICGVALAYIAYGVYVVRAGRRVLASNHWRAEHFQA